MDAFDEYAAHEREPDGDELDASYPESGSRLCPPNEDDEQDDPGEDDATGENSLGFLERHPSLYGAGRDQSGCQDQRLLSAGLGGDREDEHDGREPDDEDDSHEPDREDLSRRSAGSVISRVHTP